MNIGNWPSIDHSLLSPSGRMSKRARRAAMDRETKRLFPDGFWESKPKPAPTEAEKIAHEIEYLERIIRDGYVQGAQARKCERKLAVLREQANAIP